MFKNMYAHHSICAMKDLVVIMITLLRIISGTASCRRPGQWPQSCYSEWQANVSKHRSLFFT